MLATASVDKTVRVWDVLHCGGEDGTTAAGLDPSLLSPKLVAYKSMNVGKLFSLQYFSDSPFLLATGGDKGMVAVWESDEQSVIVEHFGARGVQRKDPSYDSLAPMGEYRAGGRVGNNEISGVGGKAAEKAGNGDGEDVEEEEEGSGQMEVVGSNASSNGEKKKKNKNKKNKK
jgi:WD40 repeat protein